VGHVVASGWPGRRGKGSGSLLGRDPANPVRLAAAARASHPRCRLAPHASHPRWRRAPLLAHGATGSCSTLRWRGVLLFPIAIAAASAAAAAADGRPLRAVVYDGAEAEDDNKTVLGPDRLGPRPLEHGAGARERLHRWSFAAPPLHPLLCARPAAHLTPPLARLRLVQWLAEFQLFDPGQA
jgi:hypothetical protein